MQNVYLRPVVRPSVNEVVGEVFSAVVVILSGVLTLVTLATV